MVTALTAIKIPCCLCGTMILPNGANQCSACLAQQFNLKDMLQKDGKPLIVRQCRKCRRYARTDTCYEYCEPESPQLLSICLKHIPAFVSKGHSSHSSTGSSSKLHVVDAIWVWTEPHSMRLKIRVTVRTEMESVQLQQRVLVEYHVHWKMCPDCDREYTNRTWQALVQLRQRREHGAPRKGLAALEMALRRNKDVRKHVLNIDSCRHGFDFYFLSLAQAQIFSQFLARLAPMKIKTTQKLVSADNHSNTANLKHTVTCDMVPLTRDDLVLVHKEARGLLAGRLGLVTKVSSIVHIVDASPKRTTTIDKMELNPEGYYKVGGEKCYPILQTSERMIRFVVLDVEMCDSDDSNENMYRGPVNGTEKYAMADVQVARESDFGNNDLTYNCVTHLGHLIQPGDVVLGYDLESTSATLSTSSSHGVVDLEDVLRSNAVLPDVVLVKKVPAKDMDRSEAVLEQEEGDLKSGGKKRGGKKKLRQQKKRDKKQRELEESAIRMGFFDEEEEGASNDFAATLENDPELAAELDAVERELETYQQDKESANQDEEVLDQ